MADRLVIQVEFSKKNLEDLKLYAKLKDFTYPGATIKDMLHGRIPVTILQEDAANE